jgi:hypothetical protein
LFMKGQKEEAEKELVEAKRLDPNLAPMVQRPRTPESRPIGPGQ